MQCDHEQFLLFFIFFLRPDAAARQMKHQLKKRVLCQASFHANSIKVYGCCKMSFIKQALHSSGCDVWFFDLALGEEL